MIMLTAETNKTESLLAAQLIAGDQAAFDALYNRYYEAVYQNALSILKDPAAAQDIVQEVFLSLWVKRNALKHPENIAGWLFVTGSNKSLNMLRKRLRERLSALPVENLSDIPFIPDDQEIAGAQLKLLQKAINALPTQRKKVFELCKLEGKTYEEVTLIMGISKNTVKSQMRDALDFVKEYITSHSSDALLVASLVAMLGC
jgi:RNA polymerase sigma-70 factor (family 1)